MVDFFGKKLVGLFSLFLAFALLSMNASAIVPQLAADACYGYDFTFDLTPNPVEMGADVTASGYVGTTYDGNPLNPQDVFVDWSSPATAIPTETTVLF